MQKAEFQAVLAAMAACHVSTWDDVDLQLRHEPEPKRILCSEQVGFVDPKLALGSQLVLKLVCFEQRRSANWMTPVARAAWPLNVATRVAQNRHQGRAAWTALLPAASSPEPPIQRQSENRHPPSMSSSACSAKPGLR